MDEQPKFNYQTPEEFSSDDISIENVKNKGSWMWSIVILIIVVIITLLIAGFVGVTGGRTSGSEYNAAAISYLKTLASDIKESETAKDIAVTLKANKQPELNRSFLGNLSNTYRQALITTIDVSDLINKISQDNDNYINLARLSGEGQLLLASFNKNLEILLITQNETERTNQLILLDQNCLKMTEVINDNATLPNKTSEIGSAYSESYQTMCESVKNLDDANARNDTARFTSTLKIITENNLVINNNQQILIDTAKENIHDSKNYIELLDTSILNISKL